MGTYCVTMTIINVIFVIIQEMVIDGHIDVSNPFHK